MNCASPWPAPRVVANDSGTTIGTAVCTWLAGIAERPHGAVATLAAGYVSIHGLIALEGAVRSLVEAGVPVRLLLGVAPTGTAQITYDAAEPDAPADPGELAALLRQGEHALGAELDGIEVSVSTRASLARLQVLLRHPLVSVRRYERRFFHPKVILLETAHGIREALVGSFNLTGAGLRSNIELGISADREQAAETAHRTRTWWHAAQPYDLAALIEQRLALYPVELVYLRMLAERFRGELEEATSRLGLTWFQEIGVAKAQAVLERRGGVIAADEVGLGKTYIAGELIDRFQRAGDGPVLVLCPAHLKRGMWRHKLAEWGLDVELLSYGQLRVRLRKHLRTGSALPQYAMIVCDEAHFLRNQKTRTFKALNSLLEAQQARPRMVLLTATPVCNKGADLAGLMHLASPSPTTDKPEARAWAPVPGRRLSQRQILKRCAGVLELSRPHLRELQEEINDLMVRRTRQYVREACRDGIERPAFPLVDSQPVLYELGDQGTALFAAVLDAAANPDALADPEFQSAMAALRGPAPLHQPLTLAAYAPDQFHLNPAMYPPWADLLLGLMRYTLLKRLESSPAAFAETVRVMAARTRNALAELDRGNVAITIAGKKRRMLIEAVRQWMDGGGDPGTGGGDELDRLMSGLLGAQVAAGPCGGVPQAFRRSADQYDRKALRQGLKHDAAVLDRLAAQAELYRDEDRKFAAFLKLFDLLNGKLVVFASSRVTTADLTDRIEAHLAQAGPHHRYHGRLASVGRRDPASKKEMARILGHFCPTTAAPAPSRLGQTVPDDLYDLLITTDVLAEGVNLQQASILINYDLPWCPTCLEQRLGRLDRIGCPHAAIHAHTFLPDQALDAWLCLMDRLTAKTAIAARLVGVSTALLPDAPVNIVNYTTLVEAIRKPGAATASRPLPASEMQRARLHQARSDLGLRAEIDRLTPWAGAVHPEPAPSPMVVYCFTVTDPEAGIALPAFARVFSHGHTHTDTERCLKEIEIDPGAWIEKRVRAPHAPLAREPVPIEALQLVEDLLERARSAVAETHQVPAERAREAIRLNAWIMKRGKEWRTGPRAFALEPATTGERRAL